MNMLAREDIIEKVGMVMPDDPWWWVKPLLLVVLAAVALGGGVLWYFRRRGKRPFPAHPPAFPEQSALERLAAVRPLIAAGRVREFVREASGILRGYIEGRFGLRAPRLSTEEFLREAERGEALDTAHRTRLAEFLFGCDRVKFALGDLDAAGMEALYETAVRFVVQTTPAAGVPPP